MDKKQVKISTLHSILHDSASFNKRSEDFLRSIESELGFPLTVSPKEDYDCSLKLIFIESGGSEMLFKEALDDLKEPFYFLTSGDNNSLAATLEIVTFLNTMNKKAEILHGSISYIASRIKSLLMEGKEVNLLKGKRYALIGQPSDWLIASIPNKNDIEEKYGIKLIDIPLGELINDYNAYEVTENNQFDNKGYHQCEFLKAIKVYEVLKKIIQKYNLDGFTIRCFDLLDTIKTTGCFALAELNKQGIIATCEGDVMAMISMAIVREYFNESSFQANPARINTEDNTILFAHCTVPFDMLSSYQYKTHFESGIGLAIKGELKEESVTIFRLSIDLKHYFVSKGVILENKNLDNLCRTQIVVKVEEDVKQLLTNPCGNHHIIFYGDYTDKIKDLFKVIGE